MSELKKVKVVNSNYIKHFSESYEKFVHLEDYQRLRDEKPKLPEGYEVIGGNLWFNDCLCIAAITEEGSLYLMGGQEPEHWQALAAFLKGAR